MKITDKELLTFCNLTNLKMEYAKLTYEIEKADIETKEEIKKDVNHTIYSLLDEEIKSFNTEAKKVYLQLKSNQFTKNKILMTLREEKKSGNKKETIENLEVELKLLEETEEEINKKYTPIKDNILGAFYSKEKNKETEYFYFDESDISKGHLGKGAPYVLERYLRYQDCENKEPHKFINEWEVLQHYDNYELAKDLYEVLRKQDKESKNEATKVNKILKENIEETSSKEERDALEQLGFYCDKVLENTIEEFPTRSEILENKSKKMQLTVLKIIGSSLFRVGSTYLSGKSEMTSKITEKLKDSHLYLLDNMAFLKRLNLDDEVINNLLNGSIDYTKLLKITARFVIETSLTYKNTKDYLTMGKNTTDKTINNHKEHEEKNLLTSYDLSVFGFNQTIDLVEEGVSCLLLKKKNTNIYSLVIKNTQQLGKNLNESLNTGKIPKEIFQLEILVQQLVKKFEIPSGAELILTGVENAGKLASLYQVLAKFDNVDHSKVFNLNITCKGFFIKKPLNMGTLVDLTPRDIFMISNKNHTTSVEMLSFSLLGKEKLDQIPIVAEALAYLVIGIGSPAGMLTFTAFVLSTLLGVISRYTDQKNYEKSIELIFNELEKNNIIEKFSKEVTVTGMVTGIPRSRIEYPYFESNKILGKVLNLTNPLVIKLEKDLNIQFKKFTSFASGKLAQVLNSNNIPEEIEIKSLKNYLTLSFLVNNLNYSTLKIMKEYIILGNKDLSDISIYKIKEDEIITLKNKMYDYKYQLNYAGGTFSSIEKVRFFPRKEEFQKNNILTKYSPAIDFNDIKVINFQNINGEAPPRIELNLEFYVAEILSFAEADKKYGLYYEETETSTSKIYSENMYRLLELFKFLQEKYTNYVKNKTTFGIGYLNKKEKHLLEKLEYSLEKKEEKENNWRVSEIEFLCGTSEEDGMVLTKGFNLYNQLTPEYKGSVLRSIFQDRLTKNNYDELSIGLKKLENKFEDEAKLYDFNEINYKAKLLDIMKYYSKRDSIDIYYPHFKLITECLKIEDLDKYTQIFTNEFGDKKLIIGNITKGIYKNEAFGYCLASSDKLLGRVLEIPLQKLSKESQEIIEEPTASPIVGDVILKCSYGTDESNLKVTSQSNLSMRGKFTATEKDNIPNINILPFGNCTNLPFNPPCPLAIIGKWENISKTFTIKGGAVLLDCSSIKCSVGGEIKPKKGIGYWKSK
ncbi:DUF4280 domain-containing protein [Cetobacterium sp. 2A]|uniref:DUF4280 domain-containing protein n=1 Tax=Cetobacterium sp. 2A TaxID=2754723 RepID=UPI00163D294C|nr:DUF4280 domain-containing protein [Cetobacterium sp. 2A]MBC2857072.1 DUF4280 domain-containing protein [Cetobacterium sp. 2A]